MRKNLGVKTFMYPQPVLIIATYNEDATANAMNAAWGCICNHKQVALYLSPTHKTVKNILNVGDFTVSMATADYVSEADYVGLVSANIVSNKLEIAGFHTFKSDFINAPIIEELPLTLECKMITYDKNAHCLIGEIINVSVDDKILDDSGNIIPGELRPITFDFANNTYLVLGEKVGNAFNDGNRLR